MKVFTLLLVCLTSLFIYNNAIAQDEIYFDPSFDLMDSVLDNRSIAMGKTAITTANGSNTVFTNPAILGSFDKGQFQIDGKLFYGSANDESQNRFYDSYETNYPSVLNRTYAAAAFPMRYDRNLQVVFGIGYQRNEGVKSETEYTELVDTWSVIRSEVVKIHEKTTSTDRIRGILSSISPGIAINVDDKYFWGISLIRTIGDINRLWESNSPDRRYKAEVETEQSATFLKLGFLGEITPEISLGITYRPAYDWEFGQQIIKITENGELDSDRIELGSEITIPRTIGIGVKYEASSDFVIAAEAQTRSYSDMEVRYLDDVDNPILDDGYKVAIGAEYLDFGLPIRFGVYRDVLPITDDNDTEPVTNIGLTVGLGSGDRNKSTWNTSIEDFTWDASLIYSRWEQTVSDSGEKYSEEVFHFGISGTYHFSAF